MRFTSPNIDLLRFSYNSETGIVSRRLIDGRTRSVGTLNHHGYLQATIEGQYVAVHRLAWRLHYGEWPMQQIDHVDLDKANNRVGNMRLATLSEQRMNSSAMPHGTTGYKGVTLDKRANVRPYRATIQDGKGRRIFLGTFDTAAEAAAAYDKQARYLHDEFARLNGVVVEGWRRRSRSAAGFRGVTQMEKTGRSQWKAMIFHDGKHFFLGYHSNDIAAALAYDWTSMWMKGPKARLNYPLLHLMAQPEDYEPRI